MIHKWDCVKSNRLKDYPENSIPDRKHPHSLQKYFQSKRLIPDCKFSSLLLAFYWFLNIFLFSSRMESIEYRTTRRADSTWQKRPNKKGWQENSFNSGWIIWCKLQVAPTSLHIDIFRATMMILITIPQRKCLHLEITIWSEIMIRRKNQSSHKLSKLKALQPHRDQKDIFEMWNRLVFTSTVVYLRIEFKINSNNVQDVQYTASDNIIANARSFTKLIEF